MIYYRQCTFVKEAEGSTTSQVAWIPEKYAVLGKSLYFGKKTNNPQELWVVSSVGDVRLSEKYILEHERDYKTQRTASDI